MKKITCYCITHAAPLLPSSWYDKVIALGEYGKDLDHHISRLDIFWHEHRRLSYGAAGSYAIPAAIVLDGPDQDLVGICSYRKAVLRREFGSPSLTYPTMREIDPDEASRVERADLLPTGEHEFLLTQPLKFGGDIYQQYSNVHEVVDLLDYTSLAVKTGVLGKKESSEFIKGQILIPGGCELGVFPKKWLFDALLMLGALGKEFIQLYGDRLSKYDAYQVRAIGFLSERLGSFLLLRELARRYPNGVPLEIFGHMTTVVDKNKDYKPGVVGEEPCEVA